MAAELPSPTRNSPPPHQRMKQRELSWRKSPSVGTTATRPPPTRGGPTGHRSSKFGLPAKIRRVVYPAKVIESLKCSLRKFTKTCDSCPNCEAALKLLGLGLENACKKRAMATKPWEQTLNQLVMVFAGRALLAALNPSPVAQSKYHPLAGSVRQSLQDRAEPYFLWRSSIVASENCRRSRNNSD